MLRVLTLCTGNICRSPISAFYLQHILGSPGESRVEVSSAGTYAAIGSPATYDMLQIADKWGFDLTPHRSRPISEQIVKSSDLILSAEPHHNQFVLDLFPEASTKLHLISETINEPRIPDPYGDTREYYDEIAMMIKRSIEGWAIQIRNILKSST